MKALSTLTLPDLMALLARLAASVAVSENGRGESGT